MVEDKPFVSILLPVYNGEEFIRSAIVSVLNQSDQDFELIISIDSCSDTSLHIAKTFAETDPRIQCYSHDKRLGMRGNYEFLLSKANGTWVSIIGQDDAIMPFAIHELRESLRKVPNLTVLTSRRSYAYWPDTNGEFGRFQFIYPLTKNKVEAKSSRKFLTKCLKGYAEYSQGPQLYTGSFVSRPVLERILISQNGELFPYPIPDVSSSASILLFVEVYHYSNLPLFLVGTSGGSTGILLERTLINHKSVSKISTAYQEAFNGHSVKTFDSPGQGTFSSFSWYLFEAVNLINNRFTFKHLEFNLAWILGALIAENPRNLRKKMEFRETYMLQLEKLKIKRFSIFYRLSIVKIVRFWNLVARYLGAIHLLTRRKLILVSRKEEFNMEIFIDLVLKASNKIEKK
jgi:glycosyltransferase involved in cell wall biosynthesis